MFILIFNFITYFGLQIIDMNSEHPIQQIFNKHFRLECKGVSCANGVKILAIHDPSALKSACAISVNVGSIQQPDDAPGLAHLLQHMLFMGSNCYPSPSGYTEYLVSHSGYQNAETCDFFTNYDCEISNQMFEGAVIQTLDAFTNPLLPSSSISAEIEAVHEEFILAGNEDESRVEQINKMFSNYPITRFTMGNAKSLNLPNIRELLVKFHEQHYLSQQINIVLFSSMPLIEMENNIFRHVAAITTYRDPTSLQTNLVNLFKFQAFSPEKTNKLVTIKSINNEDVLRIQFIMNMSKNKEIEQMFLQAGSYEEKLKVLQSLTQLNYHFYSCFQQIVCHPSQKSLLLFLEDHDLASDVTVEMIPVIPFTQYMIVLNIHLEEEDVNRIPQIYSKVTEYLEKYLTLQNICSVYQEVSYLAELSLRNLELDDMEQYVCALARDIYEVGLSNSIVYRSMPNKILDESQDIIRWCIERIVGSNLKLLVFSTPNDLKGTIKKQPYLGTNYTIAQLSTTPKVSQSLLNNSLYRLPQNPFIPLKEAIYPHYNGCEPCRIGNNIHFCSSPLPIIRGGIKLLLHNNQSYAFSKLFVQFMDLYIDDIPNFLFAEGMGLDCYFDYQQGYLYMYIFGYNELVSTILKAVGYKLGELIMSIGQGKAKLDDNIKDIFQEAIENLSEEIDNYYQGEMDELTDKIRDQLLIQSSLPLHLIAKQAEKIKKNKFLQRLYQIWRQSVTEWIVVGNFDQDEIQKIIQQFESNIGNNSKNQNDRKQKPLKQTKVMSTLSLAEDKKVKLQVRLQSQQIQTSTCLVYFDAGPYSQKLFWILQIIYSYLDEPFYQHIRTIKKLSYDLEINIVNTRGILGICFLLVSSKIDPELISRQIHGFLCSFMSNQRLQHKLAPALQKIKKSLVVHYSQPFDTVEDCFDFVCDEVSNRSYYFQKIKSSQIQEQLKNITFQDILKVASGIFKGSSLQILLVSKSHKNAYSTHRPKIASLQQIKANAQYYKDQLCNLSFNFKQNQSNGNQMNTY